MPKRFRITITILLLLCSAVIGQAATTFWAGTNIGLFKSIDGGAAWQFVTVKTTNSLLQDTPQVLAVALDPQQPATVYFVASVGGATGFFTSTDNGKTWSGTTLIGASGSVGLTWIAIDPVQTNVIYLGAGSHLRKSTDYGATWTLLTLPNLPASTGNLPPGTQGLSVDPNTSGTLYVGVGSVYIDKSTDFGNTWTQLPRVSDTSRSLTVGSVTVDPKNSSVLYVGDAYPYVSGGCGSSANPPDCGLFRSTDGGQTWTNVAPAGIYRNVAFDSRTHDLYVGGTVAGIGNGILKSSDGGVTWNPINNKVTAPLLVSDPGAGSTLLGFIGYPAGGTIYRSNDGGANWTSVPVPSQPVPGTSGFAYPQASSMAVPRTLGNVSAASFQSGPVAPESIASALGFDLATAAVPANSSPAPTILGGTTVTVVDANGVSRAAPLFYVSPGQVNYEVPAGTAPGVAHVTVTSGDGVVSTGPLGIAAVAPSLFTLNSSGLAAAYAVRISNGNQVYENVYQLDASNAVVARPIDVGPGTDPVYLLLYGTGIRGSGDPTVTVGGVSLPILYAGAQGQFVGEDQINVGPIPASMAGRGNVQLIFSTGGKTANSVNLTIK